MGLRGPKAKAREAGDPLWLPYQLKEGQTRSQAVIEFIETLRVTSGVLAGQPFSVRPWQRPIIEAWYATDAKGKRVVRKGLLSVARKNGKSGLCAALALCHLLGPECERRGKIVVGAADRDQSGLIYDEICAFLDDNPKLNDQCNIKRHEKVIEHIPSGSKFQALSSDAKKAHGQGPSVVILDELAQWGDSESGRELYNALTTGGGGRKEPLVLIISTQSPKDHALMSLLTDRAKRVRDGLESAPTFSGFVYEIPPDVDVFDETNWPLANPALGDFRTLEDMQEIAAEAKRLPALEGSFRNLYCNQRFDAQPKFIPKMLWDLCAGELPKNLSRMPCLGALDLSGTGKNDLTSLVLLFEAGGKIYIKPFFWVCADGLDEAERRDQFPYKQCVVNGSMTAIPGKALDYGIIAAQIGDLSRKYQIEALAFDPYNFDKMEYEFDKQGIDIAAKKHGQNCADMEPGLRAIEQFVVSQRLRHDSSAPLWMCLDNVKILYDSNGNRKFDKRKATGRIDGAVALAMACGLAASKPRTPKPKIVFI